MEGIIYITINELQVVFQVFCNTFLSVGSVIGATLWPSNQTAVKIKIQRGLLAAGQVSSSSNFEGAFPRSLQRSEQIFRCLLFRVVIDGIVGGVMIGRLGW